MKKSEAIDIHEVSKRSGLPASTLRFYEEKGLIQSTGRSGLRRIFHSNVLELLDLIALGRIAGFSLEELSKMFGSQGHVRLNRKLLLSKANELDQTIKRLIAVREGLRHVAHCPAPNQVDCPKFQKLLRVAAKSQARGR